MFKTKISACVAACMIGLSCAPATNVQAVKPEERIQRAVASVDSLVEKYIGKNVAGVQVSVAKDGKTILSKGYGKADVELGKPVDEQTSFNYASVSKLFIWTAAMQLKEQGKLDLNKDIREYLPKGYPMHIKSEKPVTFLNLMNHDAGFESKWVFTGPDGDYDYNETPEKLDAKAKQTGVAEEISTLGKAVCLCYSGKQVWNPGEYEGYSNYSANLAAYIVERVSGMRFCDYVQKNIFDVCGMKTCYPEINPNDETMKNKAMPYEYSDGDLTKVNAYRAEGLYASGSAVGSTRDLTLFANALMPADGKTSPFFKSNDTLKEFFEITRSTTGEELFSIHHGMWGSDGNFRGMGHDGSVNGMNSFFIMLPEEHLSVAVLANTDGASKMNVDIVELFTGSYYDKDEKVDTTQFVDAKLLSGEYVKNRNQFVNRTSPLPTFKISAVDENTISIAYTSTFSQKYKQIRPYVFECMDGDKDKVFFDVGPDGVVKKVTVFQNEWIPLMEAERILK